jgi:transposase-like protein
MKLKRTNKRFSLEFKKEKVSLFEEGKLTALQISRMYDVTCASVYRWINEFSSLPKTERIVIEKKSEELKTLELLKKVSELEKIIGQQAVQILYQESVIECGSRLIGEDLKKKSKQ